jgi:hypothetical protein
MNNPVIALFVIIQAGLILLKAGGFITASWWLVFTPAYVYLLIVILALIIVALALNKKK